MWLRCQLGTCNLIRFSTRQHQTRSRSYLHHLASLAQSNQTVAHTCTLSQRLDALLLVLLSVCDLPVNVGKASKREALDYEIC